MIKTRLLKLLKGSGKYIGANIFWQWIALLFQIAAVFAAGNMIQQLFEKTLDQQVMLQTAGIVILAICARFLCEKGAAYASYRASADVKTVLRKQIYEKLLRLGAAYKGIYFRGGSGVCGRSRAAGDLLWEISSAAVLQSACTDHIVCGIVTDQHQGMYCASCMCTADSDVDRGSTEIRKETAEQKAKEMDDESERFRKITMKVLTMQLNSVSVMDIVAYGGAAIGMIVTVKEYLAGNVSLAGAFTIILLASEFFIPLRLLGSFFHIAMNGMSASDKIFKILDMEEPKRGEHEIEGEQMDVTLQHVEFSYEPERKVLRDISLTIPSGKFVSLVGLSGCGKSTIAALLTGKNRTFSGQIQINNVPIQEIKESSLMNKITLVRHNSYLFKGTVEENLKMADPSVSREQMEAALRQVNLYEFLQMQNGLDTMLEEQGSNFSGGQRQRLAIARALLHDTPMYIFDEAASNIDVESEDQIMEVIRELAKTKTILFISHRLANVVASDQIYMLENGQITESGTHGELMKKAGSYANMYQKQQELCQVREGRA